MLKNMTPTVKLFGGIIAVVIVITVVLISISGNQLPPKQVRYLTDSASADNKVEALQTMTADLLSVENKNKKLQNAIQNLQEKNKQSTVDLKNFIQEQMQQSLKVINHHNLQTEQRLNMQLNTEKDNLQNYPVNVPEAPKSKFIWISDLSSPKNKIKNNLLDGINSLKNKDRSLLSLNWQKLNAKKKDLIKPVYTIPVNATLTGATLMTPLVGRVPIDGNLPSPYQFKLILSSHNLTANGFPMSGISGAVLSGTASGDMLGSCVRGDIHSITFIFNDGTISTTETKNENNSLGYISSQTGNPCIAGTFHSNAAVFLGAQMGLAGAQGYANALSQAQYLNSTSANGNSFSRLIGNANEAALGQGGSAAAQAAQTWWNQRVQNSFDYVFVSNINPKTHRPMKVVVNITKQIPINYDPTARKVSYENKSQNFNNQLD